jgi:hypothetical protein
MTAAAQVRTAQDIQRDVLGRTEVGPITVEAQGSPVTLGGTVRSWGRVPGGRARGLVRARCERPGEPHRDRTLRRRVREPQ